MTGNKRLCTVKLFLTALFFLITFFGEVRCGNCLEIPHEVYTPPPPESDGEAGETFEAEANSFARKKEALKRLKAELVEFLAHYHLKTTFTKSTQLIPREEHERILAALKNKKVRREYITLRENYAAHVLRHAVFIKNYLFWPHKHPNRPSRRKKHFNPRTRD